MARRLGVGDKGVVPVARSKSISRWLAALAVVALCQAAPAAALARPAAYAAVALPADARMHPDAQTEWWYFTGHLRDAAGRAFGFELVTFKLQGLKTVFPLSPVDEGYRLDFAITDEAAKQFHAGVDYVVPHPPKTIMSTSSLSIRAAGDSVSAAIDTLPGPDLSYHLRGAISAGSIDLTVDTARRPLLEGGQGVVPMGSGGYSYYYSLTNLRTRGTLTAGGRSYAVTGTTWMDHQWGSWKWAAIRGWDWMGVQLDNGTSVVLVNFDGPHTVTKSASASFPDGSQMVYTGSQMTPSTQSWTSPATGARYPQGWHIVVPALGLDAQVTPVMAAQEVVDPLGLGPSYWEGSCLVAGTLQGKPIAGRSYTELVGYGRRNPLGF